MWANRRSRRDRLWASIFADDLIRGCDSLLAVYGSATDLTLPITIPIDERGVVLLQPGGPLDAPRVPAAMDLERRSGGMFLVRIQRRDGGSMVIPGVQDDRLPPPETANAALASLTFAVTPGGLQFAAHGTDGQPVPLRFEETTARALANALLITIGMKLAKAHRSP